MFLSPSIQLSAGELHRLRVLLVPRAHQRVELLGRARADAHAEPGDLVVDLGRCDGGDHAGVELRDDVARGSRRRERTQHGSHVEAVNAELGYRRYIWHRWRALAVGARDY